MNKKHIIRIIKITRIEEDISKESTKDKLRIVKVKRITNKDLDNMEVKSKSIDNKIHYVKVRIANIRGIGIDLGTVDFLISHLGESDDIKDSNYDNEVYKNFYYVKYNNMPEEICRIITKLQNINKKIYIIGSECNWNFDENLIGNMTINTLQKDKLPYLKILYNYIIDKLLENKKLDFICIEDIDVDRMKECNLNNKYLIDRKYKLNINIDLMNFPLFRELLEKKLKNTNIKLIIADKFFPSTKYCSSCGYRYQDIGERHDTIICTECGYAYDRDTNAAFNLFIYGLNEYLKYKKISNKKLLKRYPYLKTYKEDTYNIYLENKKQRYKYNNQYIF